MGVVFSLISLVRRHLCTTPVFGERQWWLRLTGKQVKDSLADMAYRVTEQSVTEQHADGSWPYGARSHHGFIDSFHTGYNLEALNVIRKQLQTDVFDASIESGMNYYRDHFFLDDGTPKYYHDSVYPIDMHAVSQAVLTLLNVAHADKDGEMVRGVLQWAIENCYYPRTGYFYYQITPLYKNRIPYLRWTQAWTYLALTSYSITIQRRKVNGKGICGTGVRPIL